MQSSSQFGVDRTFCSSQCGRDHRTEAFPMKEKTLFSIPEPMERHYSTQEIAEAWGLDPSTVRRIFQERAGVLKIGRVARRDGKRDYQVLRIPESVVRQVYRERTA